MGGLSAKQVAGIAAGAVAVAAAGITYLCRPDEYYVSVLDIKPAALKARGVDAVILDIDNTILPRTERRIPDNLAEWVEQLKDEEIRVCLLSNNWHDRVLAAAAQLDCELVTKAVKPLPHGFFLARWRMRSRRANTVVIGDQTFTDILGAHFVGLKGLLVTPLATQDLVHTRILRKLDRVFLWGLKPQGGPPAFTADEGAEALL
jgi:HAD superfamily phosphatase (TIGR01668 family)